MKILSFLLSATAVITFLCYNSLPNGFINPTIEPKVEPLWAWHIFIITAISGLVLLGLAALLSYVERKIKTEISW